MPRIGILSVFQKKPCQRNVAVKRSLTERVASVLASVRVEVEVVRQEDYDNVYRTRAVGCMIEVAVQ
jgi:hypothetical protein